MHILRVDLGRGTASTVDGCVLGRLSKDFIEKRRQYDLEYISTSETTSTDIGSTAGDGGDEASQSMLLRFSMSGVGPECIPSLSLPLSLTPSLEHANTTTNNAMGSYQQHAPPRVLDLLYHGKASKARVLPDSWSKILFQAMARQGCSVSVNDMIAFFQRPTHQHNHSDLGAEAESKN